jgi:hypothetical protein
MRLALPHGPSLVLIVFEHILPERLHFLDMAAFAVYWNAGKQQAFGELAIQANFTGVRAGYLTGLVFA